MWAYSAKRAARDSRTLTLQENRAKAVVAGEKAARTPRFVKTTNGSRSLDDTALARARALVGLKGYVTNIPAHVMPAGEVIASYHDLWQVEQSFRMSKTDLRARPMFARTRDAIEAHLTIVFTALAISRVVQNRTGLSLTTRAAHPGTTALSHRRNQRRDHHHPGRARPRRGHHPQRPATPDPKALNGLTQLRTYDLTSAKLVRNPDTVDGVRVCPLNGVTGVSMVRGSPPRASGRRR